MANPLTINVRLHNDATVMLTRDGDGRYKMRFQTRGAWVETPLLASELGQLSGAFMAVLPEDREEPHPHG